MEWSSSGSDVVSRLSRARLAGLVSGISSEPSSGAMVQGASPARVDSWCSDAEVASRIEAGYGIREASPAGIDSRSSDAEVTSRLEEAIVRRCRRGPDLVTRLMPA